MLLLAVGCALTDACGAQSPEAAVQAAVIDSLFVRPGTRQVVIGDSTVSGGSHFVDEDYRSALKMLGALPDGLQRDFEAKRSENHRVDSLPTRVPMRRFAASDRTEIGGTRDPNAFWKSFYERFPASSGLIRISRVGFSSDGASALALVEYGCGGLCGGTIYVLLAKQADRWTVIRKAQPRVS